MIIELADALFEEPGFEATLQLYQLFAHARTGRHVLVVNPVYEPQGHEAVNEWLTKQPEAAALGEVLESSTERWSSGPAQITLVVEGTDTPTSWDHGGWPARHHLPLELAVRCAATPLRLLVENRRNDAACLRACARACLPAWVWEIFVDAEEYGWIRFEHAGGLGEMFHRIDEAGRAGHELEAARLWVLHDSDARASFDEQGATRLDTEEGRWGPDRANVRIGEVCAAAPVTIYRHQLQRRVIESYLPGRMLRRWAGLRDARQRHAILEAYMSMSDEQRHYFNMKKGLGDDAKRGLCPLYDELEPAVREPLEGGFGTKIGELFADPAFEAEDTWGLDVRAEFEPVIQSIFQRM